MNYLVTIFNVIVPVHVFPIDSNLALEQGLLLLVLLLILTVFILASCLICSFLLPVFNGFQVVLFTESLELFRVDVDQVLGNPPTFGEAAESVGVRLHHAEAVLRVVRFFKLSVQILRP